MVIEPSDLPLIEIAAIGMTYRPIAAASSQTALGRSALAVGLVPVGYATDGCFHRGVVRVAQARRFVQHR